MIDFVLVSDKNYKFTYTCNTSYIKSEVIEICNCPHTYHCYDCCGDCGDKSLIQKIKITKDFNHKTPFLLRRSEGLYKIVKIKIIKSSSNEYHYETLMDTIQQGKKPNSTKDYILVNDHDHLISFATASLTIPAGTIINNVKMKKENEHCGGYNFKIKENGLSCRTNYANNIAEYTDENVKRITVYKEKFDNWMKMKKELSEAFNDIKTLK